VTTRPFILFGGGGHARVLIELFRSNGVGHPYAVLDPDPALAGKDVLGVPVRGGDEMVPALKGEGVTAFVIGVGSVGDQRLRCRLFESALQHGLEPLTGQHPSAFCAPSAQIGPGSVLLPFAVAHTSSRIGINVIVNTSAVVEHDCIVGNHVHIAVGAKLCSGVVVGDSSHIGAGAVIRQQVRVGSGAIVAAGAVVVKDVEDRAVVAGVPARILRNSGA
jgi:sugar O-acyltransferase (sialic acid O-acetyltransferase NeuD family)